MNVTVAIVTVTGRTSWASEETISVGRFRGTASKVVKIRNDKGVHCYRSSRSILIRVDCADGVAYIFEHSMPWHKLVMRTDCNGSRCYSVSVFVHGVAHYLEQWQDAPDSVVEAHELAVKRANVCLKVMRAQYRALKVYSPVKKAA